MNNDFTAQVTARKCSRQNWQAKFAVMILREVQWVRPSLNRIWLKGIRPLPTHHRYFVFIMPLKITMWSKMSRKSLFLICLYIGYTTSDTPDKLRVIFIPFKQHFLGLNRKTKEVLCLAKTVNRNLHTKSVGECRLQLPWFRAHIDSQPWHLTSSSYPLQAV